MWDRLTSAFDNFFTGGTWGAAIGGIIGAVLGFFSPAAVPGNEIYAMATWGLAGAVGGALTFAGIGVGSGLLFGSGDSPGDPQAPSPERERNTEVARSQEPDSPSPGPLPGKKEQSLGRG